MTQTADNNVEFPSNPKRGDIFRDKNTDLFYYYIGTGWVLCNPIAVYNGDDSELQKSED